MWVYLTYGATLGVVAGVVEALVSAIGARDYWQTAGFHYCQLGIAGWFFGLVGGYIAAKRVERARERRWRRRLARGQCGLCGYNLRGNVSGVCPECGTEVIAVSSDHTLKP
jgi:hypothetical protein